MLLAGYGARLGLVAMGALVVDVFSMDIPTGFVRPTGRLGGASLCSWRLAFGVWRFWAALGVRDAVESPGAP